MPKFVVNDSRGLEIKGKTPSGPVSDFVGKLQYELSKELYKKCAGETPQTDWPDNNHGLLKDLFTDWPDNDYGLLKGLFTKLFCEFWRCPIQEEIEPQENEYLYLSFSGDTSCIGGLSLSAKPRAPLQSSFLSECCQRIDLARKELELFRDSGEPVLAYPTSRKIINCMRASVDVFRLIIVKQLEEDYIIKQAVRDNRPEKKNGVCNNLETLTLKDGSVIAILFIGDIESKEIDASLDKWRKEIAEDKKGLAKVFENDENLLRLWAEELFYFANYHSNSPEHNPPTQEKLDKFIAALPAVHPTKLKAKKVNYDNALNERRELSGQHAGFQNLIVKPGDLDLAREESDQGFENRDLFEPYEFLEERDNIRVPRDPSRSSVMSDEDLARKLQAEEEMDAVRESQSVMLDEALARKLQAEEEVDAIRESQAEWETCVPGMVDSYIPFTNEPQGPPSTRVDGIRPVDEALRDLGGGSSYLRD